MPYSEHRDLERIQARINEYTGVISDLLFTGTGLNDISVSGTLNSAVGPILFRVQITENGTDFDYFKWSKNGGRTWHATNVPIGSADTWIGLDDGIRIKFTYAGGHNVKQHTIGDYWDFTVNPPHTSEQRKMAYDWVNDRLRSKMTVPISSPSETIILAEANYACFLILRANDDPQAAQYETAAEKLVSQYIEDVLEANLQSTPKSNSKDVQPVFSRGKYDFDGNLLGPTMGRRDGYSGNLDNW
ncbi:MAG: hypothetical protein ACTSPB_16445 [Candidatus Thorarchaeota archaeon]